MTKKEIVKTISEEIGLTQLKTKEIVQRTFDSIVDALIKEGRIELRNFGVFEVKERKPRKARNPRTGEQVEVPARHVVTFKPGKEMEERVARLIEIRKQGESANGNSGSDATPGSNELDSVNSPNQAQPSSGIPVNPDDANSRINGPTPNPFSSD